MHIESLRPDTRAVWGRLCKATFVSDFYLAGGTAAALHLGHRESEDLEFFCADTLDATTLRRELSRLGDLLVTGESRGTLHVLLDGVKLSFLEYPYPMLYPLLAYQHCKIADLREIALMKIAAVSGRGSRKDFLDLYVIAREVWPLAGMLAAFKEKYDRAQYDPYHIRRSLVWFEDAEGDPWPVMSRHVDWAELKAFFSQAAGH